MMGHAVRMRPQTKVCMAGDVKPCKIVAWKGDLIAVVKHDEKDGVKIVRAISWLEETDLTLFASDEVEVVGSLRACWSPVYENPESRTTVRRVV